MKRLRGNNKGFTLIELIVVMIVIGILVLLAAPRFLNYVKDARVTALQADSKTLMDGAMLYSIDQSADGMEEGKYPYATDSNNDPKAADIEGTKTAEAIVKTANIISGRNDITDIDELGLMELDPEKLAAHVQNTKNPIGSYAIATKEVPGEVFYVKGIFENGKGIVFVHMLGTGVELGDL